MPSYAFNVFRNKRHREVLELAHLFQEVNNKPGPNSRHSLLNGGLVLLASGWEIYCEDVCRFLASKISGRKALQFESMSEVLRKDIIRYAGNDFNSNNDPFGEKIALLAGDGWRELYSDRLSEYISDFNTPKFYRPQGKNLNELFRHSLGIKKMSSLLDDFLDEDGFSARLDEIITLRGEIAHTGEVSGDDKLSATDLVNHASAFLEASAAIEAILYGQVKQSLGFAPWQMTYPIKNSLRPGAVAKLP